MPSEEVQSCRRFIEHMKAISFRSDFDDGWGYTLQIPSGFWHEALQWAKKYAELAGTNHTRSTR